MKAIDIERQTSERLQKEVDNLKQNIVEIESLTVKVNEAHPHDEEIEHLKSTIFEFKGLNSEMQRKLNTLREENSRLRKQLGRENSNLVNIEKSVRENQFIRALRDLNSYLTENINNLEYRENEISAFKSQRKMNLNEFVAATKTPSKQVGISNDRISSKQK